MQEGPQRERGNVRDGGTPSRPLPAAEANVRRTENASRALVSPTSPKARLSSMATHAGRCTTPEGNPTDTGVPGRQALELCASEHVLWESP